MTISTFEEACRAVVKECPDEYAKQYARAGIYDLSNYYAGYELQEAKRVQCLYILSNTEKWKGELASEVKKFLQEYPKKENSR